MRSPSARAASPPWCDFAYSDALHSGSGPLFLRRPDGSRLPLDIERWCGRADAADRSVLRRCTGPVLDIGCGPGRMVAELAGSGSTVLGIDPSPAAVARTRGRGGTALLRSVFEPLPNEGRWGSTLLMDGNIGLGGDPAVLLTRVRELLAPGGVLVAEAASVEVEEEVDVCLENGDGGRSAPFPWARLGPAALRRRAERAGWTVTAQWTAAGRPFLALSS